MFKSILSRVTLLLLLFVAVVSCKDEFDSMSLIITSSVEAPPHAGDKTVYVWSDFTGWDFDMGEDDTSWFEPDIWGGTECDPVTVTLTFQENADTATREATIYVIARSDISITDSLVVEQLGYDLDLVTDPADVMVDLDDTTIDINVSSNVTWDLVGCESWLTVTEIESTNEFSPEEDAIPGGTIRTLRVTFATNPDLNFREGYIYVDDNNPEGSEFDTGILVTQRGSGNLESDTQVLMELYNSLGGSGWKTPWNTGASVDTWEGVTVAERDGQMRVTGISLDGNNLTGTIPDAIGDLAYLETLIMSNNNISGDFPSCIAGLIKLKQLSLYSNSLTGTLPSTIGNLVLMERMHLSNNKLSGMIPESISNMEVLEVLTLDNNQFTGDFPEGVAYISCLKYFYVYNNYISGDKPLDYDYNPNYLQWILIPQWTIEAD